MGGLGSGWQKPRTATVGECLTFSISALAKAGVLVTGARKIGVWGWPTLGCIAFYEADLTDPRDPWISLALLGIGQRSQRIQLKPTRPNFGGCRWWFSVPLSSERDGPSGQVARLYRLPTGGDFGSRGFHGLTYRSCQESGQWRAFHRRLAIEAGTTDAAVRAGLRRWVRQS
jgi:hypothetical protein